MTASKLVVNQLILACHREPFFKEDSKGSKDPEEEAIVTSPSGRRNDECKSLTNSTVEMRGAAAEGQIGEAEAASAEVTSAEAALAEVTSAAAASAEPITVSTTAALAEDASAEGRGLAVDISRIEAGGRNGLIEKLKLSQRQQVLGLKVKE